jgi:hypothetical protein
MAWRRVQLPECPLCDRPLLLTEPIRTPLLACTNCRRAFRPSLGLVGRTWADYLQWRLYLPAYAVVIVVHVVLSGEFTFTAVGGFVLAAVIALPVALGAAHAIGVAMAVKWALATREGTGPRA